MNNQKILTGLGVLALLIAGTWYWQNANPSSAPATVGTEVQQPQTYIMSITKRVLTPDIVTVTQGDKVTIKVVSDEGGDFHISGYEIENDIAARAELTLSFTADKAGRYNFELHPKSSDAEAKPGSATIENAPAPEEDIVLGAFVVNPR